MRRVIHEREMERRAGNRGGKVDCSQSIEGQQEYGMGTHGDIMCHMRRVRDGKKSRKSDLKGRQAKDRARKRSRTRVAQLVRACSTSPI